MIVYMAASSPEDGALYEFGEASFCNAFKVGEAPDGEDLVAVLLNDEQGAALKELPGYRADTLGALAELYPGVDLAAVEFFYKDTHQTNAETDGGA